MPIGKYITPEEKEKIIEMAREGLASDVIMARMGLSAASVYRIANRAGLCFQQQTPTSPDGSERWCSGCKAFRPVVNFHRRGKYTDGTTRLRSRCASCERRGRPKAMPEELPKEAPKVFERLEPAYAD